MIWLITTILTCMSAYIGVKYASTAKYEPAPLMLPAFPIAKPHPASECFCLGCEFIFSTGLMCWTPEGEFLCRTCSGDVAYIKRCSPALWVDPWSEQKIRA